MIPESKITVVKRMMTDFIEFSDKKTIGSHNDDCGFNVVQDAVHFFTGKYLTYQTMQTMHNELSEVNKVLISNPDKNISYGEAFSLAFILPRLKKAGIIPKKIYLPRNSIETTKKVFSTIDDIPIIGYDNDEKISVTFPTIFINVNNQDANKVHGWFCPSLRSYNKEKHNPNHTKDRQNYIVIIELQKK